MEGCLICAQRANSLARRPRDRLSQSTAEVSGSNAKGDKVARRYGRGHEDGADQLLTSKGW